MATISLPDIASLPSLSDEQITTMLDLLFEPSKDIYALFLPLVRTRLFSSYPDLVDATRSALLSLQADSVCNVRAKKVLLSILGSHPRLGAKKVDSAQSVAEQAQLKAIDGSREAEQLAALNAEYEIKFPGLRYVVFVNGRPRDIIMQNMKERIARGDFSREEMEAIEAMADIAKDRAQKILKVVA